MKGLTCACACACVPVIALHLTPTRGNANESFKFINQKILTRLSISLTDLNQYLNTCKTRGASVVYNNMFFQLRRFKHRGNVSVVRNNSYL